MTFERGGRADKLGNRFERLWVVRCLLLLIEGEYTSLKWEPLGPDGKGVEGFLVDSECHRIYFQCKESAGQPSRWSIPALAPVLKTAKDKLDQDRSARFLFVSADPAPMLSDLTECSRRCDGSLSDFLSYSLGSRGHANAFNDICKAWEGEPLGAPPRSLDALSRISVELFLRGDSTHREIVRLARRVCEGDPAIIVDVLGRIAERQLGNTITREWLRAELKSYGLPPIDIEGDADCIAAVERLRDRFDRSVGHALLRRGLIFRSQTWSLLDEVRIAGDPRLVILHGNAGMGKSSVLLGLARRLREDGIPYLPLRIDDRKPAHSAQWFGKEVCGLSGSPARCLKALCGDELGVLILDQLDAIRWTSAHASDAIDVFEEIVDEALSYPQLKIVVACRTFDLEDHPRLRFWREEVRHREVAVSGLTENELNDVLARHGVSPTGFSRHQREMLRVPLVLYLWEQVQTARGASFHTPTDVMQSFWQEIYRRAEAQGVAPDRLAGCLDAMVEWMDRHDSLNCPLQVVEGFVSARRFLQSAGVLRDVDEGYAFAHQLLLEFRVASSIVKHLGKKRTISDWVRRSGQSLFRRGQLRAVLALTRDAARIPYAQAIREILRSEEIRFHLKDLVLRFLGTVSDPSDDEVDLVIQGLHNPREMQHAFRHVVWGHANWFRALESRGVIDAWLDSGDSKKVDLVIRMMGSVSEDLGDHLAGRLAPHLDPSSPLHNAMADFFRWSRAETESKNLFDLRMRWFDQGHPVFEAIPWQELAHRKPTRILRLLRRLVRCHAQAIATGLQQGKSPLDSVSMIFGDIRKALRVAAARCPRRAWRSCQRSLSELVRVERIVRRRRSRHMGKIVDCAANDTTGPSWEWDWVRGHGRLKRVVSQTLVVAGRRLLSDNPREFRERVRRGAMEGKPHLERCLVRIWAAARPRLADPALQWLISQPRRLAMGSRRRGNRFGPAVRIIRRLARHAPSGTREELQRSILAFRDAWAIRSFKRYLQSSKSSPCQTNQLGEAQHVLLQAFDVEHLLDDAKNALDQLDRKFIDSPGRADSAGHWGWVRSPIPEDRLHLVPDRQWLRIMTGDWPSRSGKWRRVPGGFREASHEQFSRDFGVAVRREPRRFAELAQRIGMDIDPRYMATLVRELSHLKKPEELPKELETTWEPPTDAQLIGILLHLGFVADAGIARGYCRLVECVAAEELPEEVLDSVFRYATEHSDPVGVQPELPSEPGGEVIAQLVESVSREAINSVRGMAFYAIRRLIGSDVRHWQRFLPAIYAAGADRSYSVRAAAVAACVPLFRDDPPSAVGAFFSTVDGAPDWLLATSEVAGFLSFAVPRHPELIEPIIERMVQSPVPQVAYLGGALAVSSWVRTGCFENNVRLCVDGTAEQRRGVAAGIAGEIVRGADSREAIALLKRFLNDDASCVRREAALTVQLNRIRNQDTALDLAQAVAESKAFLEYPGDLVATLPEEGVCLERFADALLVMCRRIFDASRRADAESLAFPAALFWLERRLLRLYERTRDRGDARLHENCLTMWDHLLAAGFGESQRTLDAL